MSTFSLKNIRGLVLDALLKPDCCASRALAVRADPAAAEEQAFGSSVKAADAPLSPISPTHDALDVLLGRTKTVERRKPRSLLSIVTAPAPTAPTFPGPTSLLSPPPSYETPLSPTAPHNDGMALLLHAAS